MQLPIIIKSPKEGGLVGKLETQIEKLKKRPFDLYVVGPFMVWYGLRSKKMPKIARRMLVTAGLFQIGYAWKSYRELPGAVASKVKEVVIETTNN